MRNIKLTIEYDGTNYSGWQIQRKAPARPKSGRQNVKRKTIQETIEKALTKILCEKTRLTVSGRTDSGVHAKGQVANFKTNSNLSPQTILRALNANLPGDIAIKDATEVERDFHSRFSAKSKVYRYAILNSAQRSPLARFCWHFIPYKLNFSLMKKEARVLLGRHDFKSFQAKDKKECDSIRTIKRIDLTKKGAFIYIDIEADGFLYNMVRNIVGTLIEIGRGKLPAGSMAKILKKKNRLFAGPTAPARGLCLLKVKY